MHNIFDYDFYVGFHPIPARGMMPLDPALIAIILYYTIFSEKWAFLFEKNTLAEGYLCMTYSKIPRYNA